MTGCGSISASAGEFTPGHPGVLTVATSAVPSPGFWEGTPSHPTGGFEYELARQMAQRFGLDRVEIKIVHFHRIVHGHLGGADLAIDLITPTAEREEVLEFSTPYLRSAPTVVVREGTDVPDLKTAQELRWGAIQATTFVETIEDQVVPEAEPILYDGQQEVVAALETGKIEATLLDLPLAVAVAERSEGKLEAVAQLPDKEALAMALPKGSPNRQAVDSAIRALTADGTIEDLLEEWVGPEAANAESEIPLLHTTLH
ncbi:MAG: amino acid ABC transporter substrate-binding protein [Actinobacteria bacterium]|nr:amino acid ABC transporter substrate-binding protein [Actinomycetota bacterium]MBS1884889.1 amino acid ABC transporter substrate-binding protein [Actinomycetota bacterium]